MTCDRTNAFVNARGQMPIAMQHVVWVRTGGRLTVVASASQLWLLPSMVYGGIRADFRGELSGATSGNGYLIGSFM